MREYRLLNNNWKFTYGDKVGASPDEINRWQDIGLPHSFGIPYFMEKEFYLGYGTYSKWFELSKEDCKKRILLKFFGAFQKAVVVLNGKQIGLVKGTKLVTKKSVIAKQQIVKYNKDFQGVLTNEETWKLVGISKNAFYKYKRELLERQEKKEYG